MDAKSQTKQLSRTQKAQMTGKSYHSGCPVGLDDLSVVDVKYFGFDKKVYSGTIVVNKRVAEDVVEIFDELLKIHYPISQITPIEAFDGSDWQSIEAGNTSAFNCRNATGKESWSKHAFGVAIDINPIENPYVFTGGKTSHKASIPYLDRKDSSLPHFDAVTTEDSDVYRVFTQHGWSWGGEWSGAKDYQHFFKD